MLGWDHSEFHQKRVGTRYAKLVFLPPEESAGDLVHAIASMA
jgi:hypothetical protein